MKEHTRDTSSDYEDMLGYVSSENNNKGSLKEFLGEVKEYKPEVKPKNIDREFPEEWQKLIVNFNSMEDYTQFMLKLDSKPVHKLKHIIYEKSTDKTDIFSFLGE